MMRERRRFKTVSADYVEVVQKIEIDVPTKTWDGLKYYTDYVAFWRAKLDELGIQPPQFAGALSARQDGWEDGWFRVRNPHTRFADVCKFTVEYRAVVKNPENSVA